MGLRVCVPSSISLNFDWLFSGIITNNEILNLYLFVGLYVLSFDNIIMLMICLVIAI